MKDKLIKLLDNSYSPYSKYKVAAIVVMKDGKEFNGVNVENASYGATVCAERVAIYNAISAGYKKNDFETMYIINNTNDISVPCFICRQVITEFFETDKKIVCMNSTGDIKEYEVKYLCPEPFNL
ncbi:MAG TPA: cytidine deaminase [Bacilli bacterium]|nr:cytidine deaminase [Bacilli bacterium]